MKKIILHIGTTKTGTTSLQEFFRKYRGVLEKNNIGFFVPSTNYNPYATYSNGHILNAVIFNNLELPENEKTQILLANPTLDNNRLKFNEGKKKSLPIDTESLKEYAKQYDTLIFSEEMIYHYQLYYDNYWQEIKKYLDEIIDEEYKTQLVIYFRRQDKWIQSEWKQTMLTEIPNSMKFFEFLDTYEKLGYLNYYDNIKKAEEVFGKENISVRNYEKKHLFKKNIICDFIENYLDFDYSDLDTNIQTNRSISTTCAYAVNIINRAEINFEYDRVLLWGFCHHPSSDFLNNINDTALSWLQTKLLLYKYRKQNQLLSEEYNKGRPFFDNVIKIQKVVRPNFYRDRSYAEMIKAKIPEIY